MHWNSPVFDFKFAFSRTAGWVTTAEQELLRNYHVSAHCRYARTARTGAPSISEFDRIDKSNFDR